MLSYFAVMVCVCRSRSRNLNIYFKLRRVGLRTSTSVVLPSCLGVVRRVVSRAASKLITGSLTCFLVIGLLP
jgi:hypothetical protein